MRMYRAKNYIGPFINPKSGVWTKLIRYCRGRGTERNSAKRKIEMGIVAAMGVLLPFPFYWWLWTNPQSWVNLCGQGRDPSTAMARVSHVLKAAQLLSLFSVASLSWPPPLYFWPLMAFGQFLNFRSPISRFCPIVVGSKSNSKSNRMCRYW